MPVLDRPDFVAVRRAWKVLSGHDSEGGGDAAGAAGGGGPTWDADVYEGSGGGDRAADSDAPLRDLPHREQRRDDLVRFCARGGEACRQSYCPPDSDHVRGMALSYSRAKS